MKTETYIVFDREEVQRRIPYALVAETMGGSRWGTGRRKRLWSQQFTEAEREKAGKLHAQARDWYLVHGVPEEVKMTPKTILLWDKLAEFCACL